MNHDQFRDALFALYDGELAPGLRDAAEAHASDCRSCRETLDGWKRTQEVALTPLRVPSSELFVQRVMRAVRTHDLSREAVRWSHFLRWAFPALALSVSSFAAALFLSLQPTAVSAESLLTDEQPSATAQLLANSPNEDQILDSVIARP